MTLTDQFLGEDWRTTDRNNSINWARKVLSEKEDWVILDTETTGLENAQIVQIGIINLDKKAILDSYVKPTIFIPEKASNIHGITDNTVKDAPTFNEIFPKIELALKDKFVLIYNAEYDIAVLNYCCELWDIKKIDFGNMKACVMEWYSQFVGEWSEYHNSYRWQRLNGDHSAIEDCQATLQILKKMASAPTSEEIQNRN